MIAQCAQSVRLALYKPVDHVRQSVYLTPVRGTTALGVETTCDCGAKWGGANKCVVRIFLFLVGFYGMIRCWRQLYEIINTNTIQNELHVHVKCIRIDCLYLISCVFLVSTNPSNYTRMYIAVDCALSPLLSDTAHHPCFSRTRCTTLLDTSMDHSFPWLSTRMRKVRYPDGCVHTFTCTSPISSE